MQKNDVLILYFISFVLAKRVCEVDDKGKGTIGILSREIDLAIVSTKLLYCEVNVFLYILYFFLYLKHALISQF